MIKAVRIHSHGGPEVMRLEEIELPPPGPGEARVRHTAIGLNFSDINVRRGGFYLNAVALPAIFEMTGGDLFSAAGYAALMRELAQRNGGNFVALARSD